MVKTHDGRVLVGERPTVLSFSARRRLSGEEQEARRTIFFPWGPCAPGGGIFCGVGVVRLQNAFSLKIACSLVVCLPNIYWLPVFSNLVACLLLICSIACLVCIACLCSLNYLLAYYLLFVHLCCCHACCVEWGVEWGQPLLVQVRS